MCQKRDQNRSFCVQSEQQPVWSLCRQWPVSVLLCAGTKPTETTVWLTCTGTPVYDIHIQGSYFSAVSWISAKMKFQNPRKKTNPRKKIRPGLFLKRQLKLTQTASKLQPRADDRVPILFTGMRPPCAKKSTKIVKTNGAGHGLTRKWKGWLRILASVSWRKPLFTALSHLLKK